MILTSFIHINCLNKRVLAIDVALESGKLKFNVKQPT